MQHMLHPNFYCESIVRCRQLRGFYEFHMMKNEKQLKNNVYTHLKGNVVIINLL